MKFISHLLLLFIALLCSALVVDGQQCNNGDFVVTNGQETLLKITAANEVFTCDRVNICDKINQGLQSISLAADGSTLSISNSNSITLPDSSATNEIQTLSITSGVLTILGGNSVELPDASATNEIQSLSISNTGVLSISSSNDVQLPDVSATNEIQTLSLVGDSLSISSGNSIPLPDASATNEIQTISVASGQLSISSGNTVDLLDLKKFFGFSVSVPLNTAKGAGETLLPFSVMDWITFPASSFDTTSGTFKPPLAGYYRVSLKAYSTASSANSDRIALWWRLNGVGYSGLCGGQLSLSDSPLPTCTHILKLNTTDYVNAYMLAPNPIVLGGVQGTECQWQAEFLGPL